MAFIFYGAGDEARTRYLHLGKVALYRMSYTRIGNMAYYTRYSKNVKHFFQKILKLFFRRKMKKGLYKWNIICYNLNCSEENMALWCSRLARQPVTLEVDGSSPFGVAKKESHPSGWLSFFILPDKDSKNEIQQGVFCKGRFYPFTKYTWLRLICGKVKSGYGKGVNIP